jgi:hypothetical protein
MSNFNPIRAASMLFLGAIALDAQATLTGYTANGTNFVYNSGTNTTYTADGNLLGTLQNAYGFENVVHAIITSSPTVSNTANSFDNGTHQITAADFGANGLVDWWGSNAFVNYLNTTSYGGYNQWRLPDVGANPVFGYSLTSGELGELYYTELHAPSYFDTDRQHDGICNNGFGTTCDTGPFTNVASGAYWYGQEYAANVDKAWVLTVGYGGQGFYTKTGNTPALFTHAWAVTTGQVSAVPIPGAVWLLGSGLLGLLSIKKRYS